MSVSPRTPIDLCSFFFSSFFFFFFFFFSASLKVCEGFDKPSPIQAQCWPVLLSGRDLVGIAKTGSGKTLAFSLPGLMHVAARMRSSGKDRPYMLVLSLTRELAMQTQVVCEQAGKHCEPRIRSVCIFGGVSKEPQKKALRKGAQVIVATPGRLVEQEQDFVPFQLADTDKVPVRKCERARWIAGRVRRVWRRCH